MKNKNLKSVTNRVSLMYLNRGKMVPFRGVSFPEDQLTDQVLAEISADAKRKFKLARVTYELV